MTERKVGVSCIMEKWLVRHLKNLTAAEVRLLDETLTRFSNACGFIAVYADEHQVYALERLRKHPHGGVLLNKRVQNKFGLQSAVTEAAMRRVVEDFAELNPKCRNSRRPIVPSYQDNDWILCTTATASIIMPTLHPAHNTQLPLRLSLATHKKTRGRLKVPFTSRQIDVPDLETWRKGRLALMRNPNPTGNECMWMLACHIEVPDDETEKPTTRQVLDDDYVSPEDLDVGIPAEDLD